MLAGEIVKLPLEHAGRTGISSGHGRHAGCSARTRQLRVTAPFSTRISPRELARIDPLYRERRIALERRDELLCTSVSQPEVGHRSAHQRAVELLARGALRPR